MHFPYLGEKAASYYDHIVRTLCLFLVGFVTQVGWNWDLINFKETKKIAKIVVANNPWAWVFFTFTCLPLQKCHTFIGFPTVTRSVMVSWVLHVLHAIMDWPICIGEMLWCVVSLQYDHHIEHIDAENDY
jgi:hypothetical protein